MIIIYFKAFILSLIQGITEFLPISSSGHLIILGRYLNLDSVNGTVFNIVIQFASAIAILVHFRKKIFGAVFTIHKDKKSRSFIYKFFIAFLPFAIVGLLFYKYIKMYLYSDLIVAISLIFGGFVLLIIDKCKIKSKYNNIDETTYLSSLKIGIFQIFSIIPGVSRSGSTIVGGLLSNLSKKTSIEFSFILAIPITICGTLFDLYKNINLFTKDNVQILIFGFITTFTISILVIEWFLKYITKHDLDIFGYYRIILGIIMILNFL